MKGPVNLVFDNDLVASLLFTLAFLSSIVGLLFLLAWLEQPASERWQPSWWGVLSRNLAGGAPRPMDPGGRSRGASVLGGRGPYTIR